MLALLLALPAAAQAGQDYRSNAIGMRLGPPAESGYVLRTNTAGDTEEETLLDGGAEVRRTVRVRTDAGVTETVTEGGVVTAVRTYDFGGRLTAEESSGERRSYRYRGDLLEGLSVSAADGKPLYSERYGYTGRGRLREVERAYTDGTRSVSSFLFVEGRLLSERLQSGERVLTVRYDASGRLLGEAERAGDTLTWQRSHSYDDASGRLVETRERHTDYTLRLVYDPSGRLAEETRSGSDPYRSTYGYDGDGRQVRLRRVGSQGTEEWQTEYDAEGHAARESYFARGRLQRVRVHTGEREWYDELYRDGKAALRVSYRNDQKVAEERLP